MDQSMEKMRKRNVVVTLLCRMVTLVCGLLIPQAMLNAFGSEQYGLSISISQFLSYISLLDGGIGSVARSVMYKPLARGDMQELSNIRRELERFLHGIAIVFGIYTLVLMLVFPGIAANSGVDRVFTVLLVIAISLSTFAEYCFSLSYSTMLHASQRVYVNSGTTILTTLVNTALVLILVNLYPNLVLLKLLSGCVYFLRPVILQLYVKKVFNLPKPQKTDRKYITQKWVGMGQNMAAFVHRNVDVALLTLFGELAMVSVYSIYEMVISSLRDLLATISSSMDGTFGDHYAKNEIAQVRKSLSYYETVIALVATTVLSVAAALIKPFVLLYTQGLTDANYDQQTFGVLMSIGCLIISQRVVYVEMVAATGHFRQTNAACYGEALLNIFLSVLLLKPLGLNGIAIGTLAATGYRMVYYAWYFSRNAVFYPFRRFLKRMAVSGAGFFLSYMAGMYVLRFLPIRHYGDWIVCGFILVAISAAVNGTINGLLYPNQMGQLMKILRGSIPRLRRR